MSAALDLSRGDRVEVHSRSAGPHQWIGGVVFKVAGKGAFVETDVGHENFYRWKDIRLMQHDRKNPRSGRRIVGLPGNPSIAEVPARRDVETPATLRSSTSLSSVVVPGLVSVPPAPKPLAIPPEHRPSPPHSRPKILMDLNPGVTSKHGVPPRQIHDPTPIGNAFRAYRLRTGQPQNELAERLGVAGSTLSQVELGDRIPNDDLILAFAEETGTQLDDLIHLRENSRMPPPASKATVAVVPPPLPSPPPPLPASPLPAPAKPVVRPFSEVVIAVENIVPMPADPGKRARWIQVVTELYELRDPS